MPVAPVWYVKTAAVLILALALAGCIAARGENAVLIDQELGGSVWPFVSGEYAVVDEKGEAQAPMVLIRTVSPTGQRIYKSRDRSRFAFYAAADGRLVAAFYSEGADTRSYSYIEAYDERSASSYDLQCIDVPEPERVLWYPHYEDEHGTCEVTSAAELLKVLDAAMANAAVAIERKMTLQTALPDEI